MTSTGAMRATARELQRLAADLPLARAPMPNETKGHFRRVNRELTWGLTLNK